MDPKSAAQVIRDTVSMDQILSLYGYKTKHGFMICPFHGDKDASMKVYKGAGGWHCFGCGKGGSVLDFVMEHEGCDFRTAVIAIDKALKLGLSDPYEDPQRAELFKLKQIYMDNFVDAINSYCEAAKDVIYAKLQSDLARAKEIEMLKQTGAMDRLKAEDFDFLYQWKNDAEYDEFRIEKIDEFMEEVAAWRRKHRKATSPSSRKK